MMGIQDTFLQFPEIATGRLRLRPIEQKDAEALFTILSDERVTEYYGHGPHRTINHTRELIRQIQERYEMSEAIRWGITFKGEDALIGSCSLHRFGPGYHYCQTGYELNPLYWRRGIAEEAMRAVLDYAFNEMGLHRVEAIIDIANAGSKGLLLKLGFSYEGNLRQRYFQDDQFLDEYYFGLLKHEWAGQGR